MKLNTEKVLTFFFFKTEFNTLFLPHKTVHELTLHWNHTLVTGFVNMTPYKNGLDHS